MLVYIPYSQGQPAELSSKFIRYSTFKMGKEQLVSRHVNQTRSRKGVKSQLHFDIVTGKGNLVDMWLRKG